MTGIERELIICGVGLSLPGVGNAKAWLHRGHTEGSESPSMPSGHSLDKHSRRRASPLTRALSDAFTEAVEQAGVDAKTVHAVFGSALGEASTMVKLLDQLWKEEDMTPMGFATSVPSTASGMVSISTQNRGFTTAVCADYDTVAGALMEARGILLTTENPVVVVCGDETSPARFVPDDESFDLLATAVCLCLPHHPWPALARLRGPRIADGDLPGVPLSDRLARNPQVCLLDLVAHVIEGRSGAVRLDRGAGAGYVVDVRVSRPA